MKRNGNQKSNRTYNPQNSKPPIPLDVDEVDAVLERFIRQKYDQQYFTSGSSRPLKRSDTDSNRSSDDQPPPLPPKPSKRFGFGFRSASSAFTLRSNRPTSPPRSPSSSHEWSNEPLRVNKQSRVFGASVGSNNENMETKLVQLRDMGFSDEKRNMNVLKGLGGNLEKTIEQLVRLGEGSAPASRSRTPVPLKTALETQSSTSTTSNTTSTNGLSFINNGSLSPTGSTGQPSSQSPGLPPAQSAMRSISPSNPFNPQTLSNSNHVPSASQQPPLPSLDQAFSNMQISQPPLFPNATGGYPNQPPQNPYARLQTMTPPVPAVQYSQTNPYTQSSQPPSGSQSPYHPPGQYTNFSPANPFSQNPYIQNGISSTNPFAQNSAASSPRIPYSTDSPQTYSPQQSVFQQGPVPQQYANQPPNLTTPQYAFTHPPNQEGFGADSAQQGWNPFQQQQLQPQQTGRLDKNSIMALYNYAHLAPQSSQNDSNQYANAHMDPSNTNELPKTVPQRSVTMPVQPMAGSKNPFQSSLSPQNNSTLNPPSIGRHMSQESVDIGGFQNGRHSPDAFANLSASHVR